MNVSRLLLPPARMAGSANGRSMSALVTRPVSTSGLWDVSSIDGSVIIVDRPVPTRDGDAAFRVQRFRSAGVTAFDRAYPYTPRPIPRSTVDSILSREDLLGDTPVPPEMLEQFRAQLGPMAYDTPVTRLLAGRDGTIWLRGDQLGLSEVDWMILDSDGEPIGSLTTPVGLRILEADRDAVWGVETDEFDVPYVVRYRIERR